MAFLAPDDDGAALEEALRFIDEFPHALPPVEGDLMLWKATDQSSETDAPATTATVSLRKMTRVQDPTVDARRRLRRKQERLALQQEATELERQLFKARRAFRPQSDCGSRGGKRVAKQTALWRTLTEERRKRQAAEALNVQLRRALADQTVLARAIQAFVGQYVGDAYNLPSIFAGLTDTVQLLHLEAESAWDPSLIHCETSEASVKTDPVVGTYSETRVSAPLGRSMVDVAALMEQRLDWAKFAISCSRRDSEQRTILEGENAMDVPIRGAVVRFWAVGALLWSRAADGLVLAYSILLFHPNGKLCFRAGGWIQSRPSPANPTGECSFQSRSRLACDLLGDTTSVDDEDTTHERSVAMKELSKKIRTKHERIHDKLFRGAGRVGARAWGAPPQQ